MNDLMNKIQNNLSTFSKGQRLIAKYIIEHYDKAAFLTASKLGSTVGVSESTVVRFATELGYAGYPQLQKALQELNVQPGERILLRTDPNGKYNKHARFNPSVLSMRAAQYLAQLPVKLVGIDAPTVENMELCDGEVHAALLKAGIPLLEGLRLEEADKENYELSALPIRLMGENGAPCRAVLIEKE